MGPEASTRSSGSLLPRRPRFSWDLKSVPWTDGKGPLDEYADAVTEWCKFHDQLADTNPNKMMKVLRGPILKSQCYGRAKDLVKAISNCQLNSENGASFVVNAIHKRDPLSFVTELYTDFSALLSTRRQSNEKVKNFETRFEAQLSRFNPHGAGTIPESLLALLLLANAEIEDNRRVSILAAPVNSVSTSDGSTPTVKGMLAQVRYWPIAAVLRQCDRSKSKNDENTSLNANYIFDHNNGRHDRRYRGGGNSNNNDGHSRPTRTAAELAALKGVSPCNLCKKKGKIKYGHWSPDHNPDGTLKLGVISSDTPVGPLVSQSSGNSNNSNSNNGSQSTPNTALDFTSSLVTEAPLQSDISAETLHCNVAVASNPSFSAGPMVDHGAPFSAIGNTELMLLRKCVPSMDFNIEAKPAELSTYCYWQYGNGSHSSPRRKILGSVVLYAWTNNGNRISIRHIVVDGSSQWIIGRNLTRRCNLEYIGRTAIRLPNIVPTNYLDMYDFDMHSHVKLERFGDEKDVAVTNNMCTPAILDTLSAVSVKATLADWTELRKVIDRVHQHVCGHATFSDMRTLLMRTKLWNEQTQSYLTKIIDECSHCKAASPPTPNRRVSLSSLNRAFNDILCLDHCFLDYATVIHCMDVATRFSTGAIVESTDMKSAIFNIELTWISQFWPPVAIQADGAFANDEFNAFLERYRIEFRLVPPRRHSKNPIEPRHGVLRSIFLKMKHAEPHVSDGLLAIRAIRVSNDLYGTDTLSSYEMAKGFTKPICQGQQPIYDDSELQAAHDELIAKRKLTLILRSKTFPVDTFKAGDMVQVFIRDGKTKRGARTSPLAIISINPIAGSVTVPGRAGKTVSAAVKDVRAARTNSELATMIQESIDQLDMNLVEYIDFKHNDVACNGDDTKNCQPEIFNGTNDHMLPVSGDRIAVFLADG